jgi:hypothetical protein
MVLRKRLKKPGSVYTTNIPDKNFGGSATVAAE